MKSKQRPSLAEKIADILNTAPKHSDPEDEPDPETNAKVIEDIDNDVDADSVEEQLLSKFRKQNVDLLADIDERYAGKKASRKSVQEVDDSDDEEEIKEVQNSDSEDEINSDDELELDHIDENRNYTQSDDEEQETNDDSDQDQNEEVDDEETDENETDEGDENSAGEYYDDSDAEDTFQHMSNTDVSSQVNKGLCVKNQLSMCENLLEMRLHLQKSLIAANKMPPHDKYQELRKEVGQEFTEKVSQTKASVGNLLDKLLLLQSLVRNKYPETKNLGKEDGTKKVEDGDEEIPSDTDNEEAGGEEVASEESKDEDDNIPVKKRKLNSDYEKQIAKNFNDYKPYRNTVIQKWHEKTRLFLMKGNAASSSIIEHIEHVLRDRPRLVKRTQFKRSEYKIIGEQNEENSQNSRISQLSNSEIFDDDDFYHQLLRELIEVKSADITDPVQLSRQWIRLQNFRSKMKRKIDTKASKGRKIRYTVHTKLISFMAPINKNFWTDAAKDELYRSLFGKKQGVGS